MKLVEMKRHVLHYICLCPSKYFESTHIQLEISQTFQRQLAPLINVNEVALVVVYFVDIQDYSNVFFQSSFILSYMW